MTEPAKPSTGSNLPAGPARPSIGWVRDIVDTAVLVCLGFMLLKLTGDLTWEWGPVLVPAWIAIGFAVLGFLVVILARGRVSVERESRRKSTPVQRGCGDLISLSSTWLVVFVVLKATGDLDHWAWEKVLIPLYVLVGLVGFSVVARFMGLFHDVAKKGASTTVGAAAGKPPSTSRDAAPASAVDAVAAAAARIAARTQPRPAIVKLVLAPKGDRAYALLDDETVKAFAIDLSAEPQASEIATLAAEGIPDSPYAYSSDGALAVSPDGRLVAFSVNHHAVVVDVGESAGSEARQLGVVGDFEDDVTALCFTRDPERLLVGCWDGVFGLCTIDPQKGDSAVVLASKQAPFGSKPITSLALTQLMHGGSDGLSDVLLVGQMTSDASGWWLLRKQDGTGTDADVLEQCLRLDGHHAWVSDIAVARDGATVLVGATGANTKLWARSEPTNNKYEAVATLPATIDAAASIAGTVKVYSVSLSGDGALAVTGTNEALVHVWRLDPAAGSTTLVTTIEAAKGANGALARLTPDGRHIIATALDGFIAVHTVADR